VTNLQSAIAKLIPCELATVGYVKRSAGAPSSIGFE
jgi:hypothetical protein